MRIKEERRTEMETSRKTGEEERRKEADNDGEEKVFCLWRVWTYGL